MIATSAAGPTVYTIPSGTAFLDALAAGLLARAGDDPAALARATVLLSTRRACRALGEAFLRRGQGRPVLLPRMMPLGDVDDDDLALAEAAEWGGGPDIPPAIPDLRRRLALAREIMAQRPVGPDQAARLAAELARLLDQVHTERLSFDRLADLAPDDLAEHWQVTLDFLGILTERWPALLAAEGGTDPAARRNLALDARAAAWRRDPPRHPVIAAGSTGSIPATADLLAVVAGLPDGSVVLPGLDRDLDDDAWGDLPPSHPQHGMARLLAHLGVERSAVGDWPAPGVESTAVARAALIGRALLPPAATGEAMRFTAAERESFAATLADVATAVVPTPREEAGVIALALREALETPGRTAILVTPDRGLARRVAAEMQRWGVDIDDSAGRPLALTRPGVFLRLVAAAAAEELAPVALLALLKHPLAALGRAPADLRARARDLEREALRGVRPAPGIAGLRAALGGKEKAFADLLPPLEAALHPLLLAFDRSEVPLAEVLRAHVAAAEALAATGSEAGTARLWAGDDGEAAAGFVADVLEAADALGPIGGRDYPALFESLMDGRVVRPRYGRHPRLAILGLLEARLQQADLMVLGGLNEGTWPPDTQAGPWMSRPMMRDFGLPLPERRIGLTAHDFAQAFCARQVLLTRSERVDGTPTVPSRWWVRLATLVQAGLGPDYLRPDLRWPAWLDALDRPAEQARPIDPPRPTPPVEARPRTLPVTRIETWIRDPYAVYARHVLGLKPLDPLDQEPGAAERGILLHEILERFVRSAGHPLADDALDRLIAIGNEAFRAGGDRPGLRAFWWPRFVRAAHWFITFEQARRGAGWAPLPRAQETKGTLPLTGVDFVLEARADRVDRHASGGLAIIDYKTGAVPSASQVKSGLAPQLTLEAAMAARGAFPGIDPAVVDELVYVKVAGARVAGKEQVLDDGVTALADDSLAGLTRLVGAFARPETPYPSRPRVQFEGREGDYDHLSRVGEWGVAGGDDEA